MMLPISFKNFSWSRFSKYTLFENESGIFVSPDKGSQVIHYDVHGSKDNLLKDYLSFGEFLFNEHDELKKNIFALNLANKYGLLGICDWHQYYDLKIDSLKTPDLKVFEVDDYWNAIEMSMDEYSNNFFPDPSRQPLAVPSPNPDRYINDLEKYTKVYREAYSERVEWIAEKALRLYTNYKKYNDLKNHKELDNLSNVEYFNKIIDSMYSVKNIELYTEFNEIDGAALYCKASKLSKMIDMLYLASIINDELLTCAHCGKRFIKQRKGQTYCSAACGNNFRVKKFNDKKAKSN